MKFENVYKKSRSVAIYPIRKNIQLPGAPSFKDPKSAVPFPNVKPVDTPMPHNAD